MIDTVSPNGNPELEQEQRAIDSLTLETLKGLEVAEKAYMELLKEGEDDVLTVAEKLAITRQIQALNKTRADIIIARTAILQKKLGVTVGPASQPPRNHNGRRIVAFQPRSEIVPSVALPITKELEEP